MPKIFVTVGTTSFDKLIDTILSDEVLLELNKKGYDELIMQIGNTTMRPDCTSRCGFKQIGFFQLLPSIQSFIRPADLVISHSGAGSCLEVLEAEKPLIVVINRDLMDNHQLELAQQLEDEELAYCCSCDNLLDTIRSMEIKNLRPRSIDNSKKIATHIDQLMGFSQSH